MNSLYLAHPYEWMAHYGIPGMQWGRRRFQNKDGSLTPAGQKRYAKSANVSDGESDADKRDRLLRSYDPIELYSNRHLLSSNEINERINRINTEMRLSEIAASYQKANSPAARGKKIVDTAIGTADTAIKIYGIWNSDAGKAARKFLGLKVPGKNDAFNALVEQYKNSSNADIIAIAQRMENLRKIERNMYGTGGDNKK